MDTQNKFDKLATEEGGVDNTKDPQTIPKEQNQVKTKKWVEEAFNKQQDQDKEEKIDNQGDGQAKPVDGIDGTPNNAPVKSTNIGGNQEVVLIPDSDKQMPLNDNTIGEPAGEVLSNSVDQNQASQSQQDSIDDSDEENSIHGKDLYGGSNAGNSEDKEGIDVSQVVKAGDQSPRLNSSLKDKKGTSFVPL